MLKRENEHTEFKKSTGEKHDAMKSVCGMLNKYGEGTIYFGIKNDGTPLQNIISDSSLRDISRVVYESIEPKITPTIETVLVDDIEVIKLSFFGSNRPYSSKGVYYTRSADENRPMSQKELLTLFQSANYEDDWEKEFTSLTIDDIDDETLFSFYNNAKKYGRLEMDYYNKRDLLVMLGVLIDNKINKAGYALFGKKANIELKMALFATKEKINFIDLKDFKGNIYNLVNEGINYILSHINWRVEIGKRQREEIPEIPEKAIREIVVNCFAHAKYNDLTTIEINIFPTEIEIYNPGSFPENYSPYDFIDKKVQSIKRNPIILDVLFRSKDVEKTGTGFSRVNNLCNQYNIKWNYQKENNGFKFIFYRESVTNNGTYPVTNPSLTAHENAVMKAIKGNSKITVNDIATSLDISDRTVQRTIKSLTEKRIIERIGTKNGYWKVIDKS
ncbi:MAG: putative DNA binding domain-containing protein [Erysipelotrichaceae bacterium]|nr:putative DNA binding domain-containing protein [Erysipelotrichaceae bacterium]